MSDYKPNSHKAKAEEASKEAEKRAEKVVKGTVKTKKKNGVSKLTDVFISEDAANVKSYVFMDVLVPAIKKAVCDIVVDGINMILFGDTGRGKRSSGSSNTVSYSSYYGSRNNERSYAGSGARQRNSLDFDDIIFENRGEATAALDQMYELLDRYGVVRVADLYDMADLSAPYTSNRYGWTNLRDADVARVRDGYIIKLPKATVVD